jgi:hypothetical protein
MMTFHHTENYIQISSCHTENHIHSPFHNLEGLMQSGFCYLVELFPSLLSAPGTMAPCQASKRLDTLCL